MSQVLIISPEEVPFEDNLAGGPGIRYWEFAQGLKRYGHKVTLAIPESCYSGEKWSEFTISTWDPNRLNKLCTKFDIVILPHVNSFLSTVYTHQVDAKIPTIVDLYDPVLIENINLQHKNELGLSTFLDYLKGVTSILGRGDFFICANERQYYYHVGVLNALGRINPLTYHRKILEIVPFGVPDEDPVHSRTVMRGRVVRGSDLVILWFSGIYPWFDAVTLVRAMPEVLKEVPQAKLVVMGGIHPKLHAPADEYKKTVAEAERLNLKDKVVFFTEWRPYAERANWYLESDIAVCTYKSTIETLLSHRTRVVDLLWGGLPVITSDGDELSSLLEVHGCGQSVSVGDQKGLATAIVRLLKDKEERQRMSQNARKLVKERFTWAKVLEPVNEFCKNPELAADRIDRKARQSVLAVTGNFEDYGKAVLEYQLATEKKMSNKVRLSYQAEGLSGFLRRIFRFLARRLRLGD